MICLCATGIQCHHPSHKHTDYFSNCAQRNKYRRQTCHQCRHGAHQNLFERWHLWMDCRGIASVHKPDYCFHPIFPVCDARNVPKVDDFEPFVSIICILKISFMWYDQPLSSATTYSDDTVSIEVSTRLAIVAMFPYRCLHFFLDRYKFFIVGKQID